MKNENTQSKMRGTGHAGVKISTVHITMVHRDIRIYGLKQEEGELFMKDFHKL